MYKKIIAYVLILGGLSVIAFVYFRFSDAEKKNVDPYNAIHSNVSFILEVSTFENIAPYTTFLKDLASSGDVYAGVSFNPLSEWPAVLSAIDSLRTSSDKWHSLLMQQHVVLASTNQGHGDEWFLSIGLSKDDGKKIGHELMQAWFKQSTPRNFKNAEIRQNGDLQYAIIHDCLVVATTNSIMEDVIIRVEKNDLITARKNFVAAHDVASADVPLHFYSAMDNEEWLQVDPVFAGGKKMLSGYALLNDSTSNAFGLASDGAPYKIAHVLPENTSMLEVFSYTDFETGWRKHGMFYPNQTHSKFWDQAWKDLGDTCQCDLNEAMLSWRSGEWGSALIALSDSSTAELDFFRIKDSINVIALMQPVLVGKGKDNIFQLRYPQLFERNRSMSFLVEANFITQVGEYIFVASTPADLLPVKNIVAPLSGSTSYKKARANVNPAAALFIYQTDYYTSPLPSPLIHVLKGNDFVAASVEHFRDTKYLVNIMLPFEGDLKEERVTTSTTVETDAPESDVAMAALNGPWTVINHNTKENEKLLQDENKDLCLYGADGKLLWKKELDAEVLGDVVQIDALKNGKLQYAFTTTKALHIIDRNGNELQGFPVLPLPPISTPLHVADYDGDRKYRLLFAAGDDYINNYSVKGAVSEGWRSRAKNGHVTWIDHFRIGKEDILIAVNAAGKLDIMKRTGDIRHVTSTELIGYDGNKIAITSADKIEDVRIDYTNARGEMKSVKIGK